MLKSFASAILEALGQSLYAMSVLLGAESSTRDVSAPSLRKTAGLRPVFEPGVRYPDDGISEYVDLDGKITYVEPNPLSEEVRIRVLTDGYGEFTAYTYPEADLPLLEAFATIRVYSKGEGWYPENRLISWYLAPRVGEDVIKIGI